MNESMDKEMHDESVSKQNYDLPNASRNLMAQDLAHHSAALSHARTSTLMQNNGNKIKVLKSESDKTMKVAWSPNSNLLVFGGDKDHASLWNLTDSIESAVRIQTMPHCNFETFKNLIPSGHNTINAIDWKSDGSGFASATTDGITRLWDNTGEINRLCMNENSMPLRTKDGSGSLNQFGANSGMQDSSLYPDDLDSVYEVKYNQDSSALVTVSEKNNVVLWSPSGEIKMSYTGHTDSVVGLSWRNKNMFATASQNGVIKIWDVQKESAVKTYNAHENSIKSLDWDAAGALLASGSEDCRVKIWNIKYDVPILEFKDSQDIVHKVQYTPTGIGTDFSTEPVKLAACSGDGNVYIYDIVSGTLADKLTGHNGMVM